MEVGSVKFSLNERSKEDYLKYAVETLELLRINGTRAEAEMNDSIDLLISLTEKLKKRFKRFKSIEEVDADFPDASFGEILDIILTDPVKKGVTQIRLDISYVNFLLNVIKTYPKRTIANTLFWLIIENSMQYLPKRYQNPNLKFKKIVDSTLKDVQRWERCMRYTEKYFQYGVDALHAKHYIKKEARDEVERFYQEIRSKVETDIQESVSVDQDTKSEAIKNLTNYQLLIGYRDEILNETNLMENYKHFWPVEGLGQRNFRLTSEYLNPTFLKSNPLKGTQFFELALLIEDRSYLGSFRKILEPHLLDFQYFPERLHEFDENDFRENESNFVCKLVIEVITRSILEISYSRYSSEFIPKVLLRTRDRFSC